MSGSTEVRDRRRRHGPSDRRSAGGTPHAAREARGQLKVVIQIPCYNEEATLATTLGELPRTLPGVGAVEWLVIDDGSTDRTLEVARANHVDHVVTHRTNEGLAKAFTTGLEASLRAGADVIVNTDADNQYRAQDIPRLIQPILEGRADIVVGARPIHSMSHFSPVKKALQRLGSWMVRLVSGAEVPDAPSGFRAYSRSAAMRINVFNSYTYTLETLIQAGRQGLRIESVPIGVNADQRPSRLVRSVGSYVVRSAAIILHFFLVYKPLRAFLILGSLPFAAGFALGVRYLVFFFQGSQRAHAPSLILAAILFGMGFGLWMLGLLADLLAINRRLLEDVQARTRELELDGDR